MSLIFKNGKMYGGNDVAANPTLTPSTRDLGSISIDGVTYNVGGNTGTAYKETVLWEGSESTSRWVEPIVLQNIDIGAYDQIIVELNNSTQHIISANQIPFGSANPTTAAEYVGISGYLDNDGEVLRTIYLNKDLTNIFRVFCSTGKGITLTKVVGIKTGVGGGATSADWELLASVTGSEVVDISKYYTRADEFNIVLKVDGYDDQVLTTTFPKSAIPESNGRISLGRNYCDALVKVSPASIQLYQCRGNSSEDVLSTTTMDVYYRKSGAQICFGFIDTTNVIVPFTVIQDTQEHTYTATQDCYAVFNIANSTGTSTIIKVDNIVVDGEYSATGIASTSGSVPLRKGQTFSFQQTFTQSNDTGYAVYGIARGSEVPAYDLVRGNVYGAFLDTNRIIQTQTPVPANSSVTYTATEDCFLIAMLARSSKADSYVAINGVTVLRNRSDGNTFSNICGHVYLKKGDVATIKSGSADTSTNYTVYGLSYGTQNIFAPQIYSLSEREVGTWIDNKPLYVRTFDKRSTVYSRNSWNRNILGTTGISIKYFNGLLGLDNSELFASYNYYRSTSEFVTTYNMGNDLQVYCSIDSGSSSVFKGGIITIWYTKDTDVPGSGQYNTLGVPTVHYTTDEQVVGTYLGKPLYQRVITPIVTASTTLAGDIKYGSFTLGDYINSVDMAFVDLSASYIEPATGATRGLISAYYEKDSENIVIVTMFTRTNSPSSLCIKYTKITD